MFFPVVSAKAGHYLVGIQPKLTTMKPTMALLCMLYALPIFASAQKPVSLKDTCCRDIKKKIAAGTYAGIDIFFDKAGKPEMPRAMVPYNSQVNIKVKNLNPLSAPPVATLSFLNFNATVAADVPSLSQLLPPVGDGDKKSVEEAKKSLNEFVAANAVVLDKINGLAAEGAAKVSLELATAKQLQYSLFTKSPKAKNPTAIQLQKRLDSLQTVISELQQTLLTQQALQDSIMKRIKKLDDLKSQGEALVKAYNTLHSRVTEFQQFLTIETQINSLFKDQFIDADFTHSRIDDILKANIRGVDLNDLLRSTHEFLNSLIGDIISQITIISSNYELINKVPVVDSFSGSGKFDLTAQMKIDISKMTVSLKRDELFKTQKLYADAKFKFFSQDSIRNVLFTKTDTILLKAMALKKDNFERTIKSFQANADQIKVTLPFPNTEPYVINTYCRFKVEGSTGIFAHFGGSDDKFKVIKNALDSNVLIRQKKEAVVYSLGFLAQFYNYDKRKDFNWGGMVGLNVPVANSSATSNIQLVAGICMNSTSIEKLSLNFGISLRKGQVLNTNNLTSVNGNEVYKFNNRNDFEPIYDPVYKLGAFFGITYSLFTSKSTDATK